MNGRTKNGKLRAARLTGFVAADSGSNTGRL